MVTCRMTDIQNSHHRTGSASSSHVPSNKSMQTTSRHKLIKTALRWIWPKDRCTHMNSPFTITKPDDMIKARDIEHIRRSASGRFAITNDTEIEVHQPIGSSQSVASESDDGGFLPRQNRNVRTFSHGRHTTNSTTSSASQIRTYRRASYDGLLRVSNERPMNILQIVPIEHHPIPPTYQNIDTLDRSTIRQSRIISSSPAVQSPMSQSSAMLSPQTMYFSDLSSVLQTSSRDPTLQLPHTANITQLQALQERYAQELPSLRAIHEETRRMAETAMQSRVPASTAAASMGMWQPIPYYCPCALCYQHLHSFYRQSQPQPLVHQRPRSRLLPKHVRITKSAPELATLNGMNYVNTMAMEVSPESQSNSSGFGSRNTSQTQQNSSTLSNSVNSQTIRHLPPYRSPPHPYYQYDASSSSALQCNSPRQRSSPYTMDHWLELIRQMSGNRYLLSDTPIASDSKAVDVGSVDLHYEFDQTPTPSASTPTRGTQDDIMIMPRDLAAPSLTSAILQTHSLQPYQRKRVSKYDNIEARVQAMKEEFHEYRKRQAMQSQRNSSTTANSTSIELESAC